MRKITQNDLRRLVREELIKETGLRKLGKTLGTIGTAALLATSAGQMGTQKSASHGERNIVVKNIDFETNKNLSDGILNLVGAVKNNMALNDRTRSVLSKDIKNILNDNNLNNLITDLNTLNTSSKKTPIEIGNETTDLIYNLYVLHLCLNKESTNNIQNQAMEEAFKNIFGKQINKIKNFFESDAGENFLVEALDRNNQRNLGQEEIEMSTALRAIFGNYGDSKSLYTRKYPAHLEGKDKYTLVGVFSNNIRNLMGLSYQDSKIDLLPESRNRRTSSTKITLSELKQLIRSEIRRSRLG